MSTLLVSTRDLPSARDLADAATCSGWHVHFLDEGQPAKVSGELAYYGGSDIALAVAAKCDLALLEPPLDLLARLPSSFLQRTVQFANFAELHRLKAPAFVKPADAVNKSFDAGIYADARHIRAPRGIDPQTPVLVSEPVEWLAEYRCFVLEGKVAATTPYLSFGRPVWRPFRQVVEKPRPSASALALCDRLLSQTAVSFPPAFVVDVGLIEDRGWAVVEFNPAWCSGLLGTDPERALPVIQRACRSRRKVSKSDRNWLVERRSKERHKVDP